MVVLTALFKSAPKIPNANANKCKPVYTKVNGMCEAETEIGSK